MNIGLRALVLTAIIHLIRSSVVVISPTESFNTTITPAPHVVYGLSPFNITGELVNGDPFYGCTSILNNVTNKIILLQYETCLSDIMMQNAIEANALGVIINGDDYAAFATYYMTNYLDYGQKINISAVAINTSQWMQLMQIMNSTNQPVIVQITSGDFNIYEETTKSPSFWILHLLLVILSTLVCIYGLHKLITYIRFYGSEFSISQVSLGLLSISALLSMLANAIVIAHFHHNPIPDPTYFAIYVSGPMFVIIATILVGLYWSGLIFHKQQRRFWSKYLFGAVIALLGVLFALNVIASVILREVHRNILVVLIVIALVIGLYFILIGTILVCQITRNSRKISIVSTKKRYPQRLVKMLIVSGVSLVLFVVVSMLTQSALYPLADWQFFILGMTQFFSIMTVAAEITLFKRINQAKQSSGSRGAKSSQLSTSAASATTEGHTVALTQY